MVIFGNLKIGLLPPMFRQISAGLLILIAQIFVWISADLVFGQQAALVKGVMMTYFILFLVTRVGTGTKPSTLLERESGFFNFLLMFSVTAAFLIILSAVLPLLGTYTGSLEINLLAGTVSVTTIGFGILHGFIKAYIEEDVFRDALPRAGLGDILSNILFAMFHLSVFFVVYGFGIPQAIGGALTLFVLGMIWSQVRNNFGVLGATASHLAWNIFAMGALGLLIGSIA